MRFFILAGIWAVVLSARILLAADLGIPQLSGSPAIEKYFDPDRFLTSGGLKYLPGNDFTLEPRIGVGYDKREMEAGSGFSEVVHKIHAQAGGKIDLSGILSFSAAAKLPVYTYELTDRRFGEDIPLQSGLARYGYDLLSRPGKNLSWTGEMGLRLGLETDLSIFYDRTSFSSTPGSIHPDRMEEKFGTRIIFHFR